jgi:hypothetical protein
MKDLPHDPFMLMSIINMKLRDCYPTLDALCEDMNIEKEVLTTTLGSIGMEYNPDTNKFW